MSDEDTIALPQDDFRRERRNLTPWVFAGLTDDEATTWPPPSDLISREHWDAIMALPTDVALTSTSYEGTLMVSSAHSIPGICLSRHRSCDFKSTPSCA
jgi:hypothetical protein